MKSRKKSSKRPTRAASAPRVVYEFVMLQMVLRSAGFKSSELSTLVKEDGKNVRWTSIDIIITRGDLKFRLGVGMVAVRLPKAQALWNKWITHATTTIMQNFDAYAKKSVAFVEMERILESLEKAGFRIVDSLIYETFDVLEKVVH